MMFHSMQQFQRNSERDEIDETFFYRTGMYEELKIGDRIRLDKRKFLKQTKEKAPPTITSEEQEEVISADTSNDNYIVYRTATGKKFHRDGCSYLKSKFEIIIEEARRRGLSPCLRCCPPS